jgi:NADH pyrophosphatase NudC (nudix superfamily)
MQLLKGTGIEWQKIRLISKLYMEQGVKVGLDQGETRSVKTGKDLGKVAIGHRFCSTCTASTLPRKLLKGLETSKYQDK